MKILCLPIIIMFSLLFTERNGNNPAKNAPPVDSALIKLKIKLAFVNRYIIKHDKTVIILVKVPDKKNLVRVKNERWPDEIEYSYNLLKDSTGKIVFIAQIPFSESGDWNIEYKHYFDEHGNTYAFYREESIFDNTIKGGVIRSTLLKYYDNSFNTLDLSNGLTDKDYHPIRKSKNNFDFRDYEYHIYKNLNECLSAYHIQLPN